MIRRFLNIIAVTAAVLAVSAPVRAETIAIVNAHILTAGPVGEVPKGTVVLRDGKILAAGASISAPDNARIIDARGGRVTSGLIATDTALGLMEVSSVRGTVDGRTRNSEISAAFDVQYGLNPASTLIPVARLGGVTRGVTMPGYDDGNEERELPFAGQAAMISLGEGSSILFRPKLGMVLELGERGGERAGGSRAAEFVQLRIIFNNVKLYRSRKFAYDKDKVGLSPADLEALVPVVEGRMPLIVLPGTINSKSSWRVPKRLGGSRPRSRQHAYLCCSIRRRTSLPISKCWGQPCTTPHCWRPQASRLHSAAMMLGTGYGICVTMPVSLFPGAFPTRMTNWAQSRLARSPISSFGTATLLSRLPSLSRFSSTDASSP